MLPRACRSFVITLALPSGIALVALGCAARPLAGASSGAPLGSPPTTIEGAQSDIDHWREALGVPAASPATTPQTAPTVAPAQPSMTQAPTTKTQNEGVTNASGGEEKAADAPSVCATPCRAISSMRRSVGVLCNLSGESDARCVDARRVLQESEQRVASCSC